MLERAAYQRVSDIIAERDKLRDETFDAQRQLAALFPDRVQDGTLSHAVLVVKAEVQKLVDHPNANRR